MKNNKFLTRTFRDMPYDKYAIMFKDVYDLCYVFDMAEYGNLVSARTSSPRDVYYPYITDIMEPDEIKQVTEYFKTFPQKPMLVNTKLGLALALPWLFPSASYVMLSFLKFGTDKCYRALLFDGEILQATSTVEALHMRARQQKPEIHLACERYFTELEECFASLVERPLIYGNVTHELEGYIYALSNYIGCGVSVECDVDISCAGQVDVALFESFAMIFMICARRNSKRREVTFEIRKNSRGMLISASFNMGRGSHELYELDTFERLCARKCLRFEHVTDGETVHAYFEPMRIDWSILGVKQTD
ncbi:MAG: hypothetical protein E7653_04550 [Ruminococcaceae bacterium]|nr:hypothetical protein [Oscillospiraceae bacterium]